jgi:hypothetical protein
MIMEKKTENFGRSGGTPGKKCGYARERCIATQGRDETCFKAQDTRDVLTNTAALPPLGEVERPNVP